MKKINNFINEKLKVNSKTNLQSTLLDEILEYWGLYDEDDEINNAINQWIKDNNVNNVQYIADKETLKGVSEFIEDNIIKQYKSDMKFVEDCEHELEKAENIYHHSGRGEKIDIEATDDMICIIGWYGTLYCVKNK